MTGTQSARLWMLLRTEQALGLESVPWKLDMGSGAVPGARSGAVPMSNSVSAAAAPPAAPPRNRPRMAAPQEMASAPRTLEKPVHPVRAGQSRLAAGEIGGPVIPLQQRKAVLEPVMAEVMECRKCRLCEQRKNAVFGEGALDARLMFIGEGPGETEDDTGRPFVGRAGQLLTKMIAAMGLTREQVYIANVVKCRPPGNRTPSFDEVETCTAYLVKQIEIIRPQVIVTLGLPATQYMLSTDRPMRELRGVWQQWRGIKVMPTYHPSYVLRTYTQAVRGTVWGDLQKVMQELGLPLKAREQV